jgi:branched-chain amino acid transport system substrate-binding protein
MKFFSLTFLFILTFVSTSCEKESNQIVIGFFGALTGTEATFGVSSKNGITLALEELNVEGGLLGKKVELKTYDTLGSLEETKLSVERLIKSDDVVAVIGEVASSRSLVAAPIAQSHKIPMVTPSSTNPEITQVGDYIFRVCFIDPFQGEVMAKFAFHSLKLKKAAVLRDTHSQYSVGLANYFIKTFTALGGTILADENYISGDVDFQPQLLKIRKKNPEFIFVPGYYSEVAMIARQSRDLGFTGPLMGGDGWDDLKNLTAIAGDSINGSYFSNHYTLENPNPEVQKFISVFEKRFGVKPDSQAALGYDAARIIFDAIRRAKSIENQKIRNALSETKDFKGITGTISINQNRDAVKPAVVLQVKKNNFSFVETVGP